MQQSMQSSARSKSRLVSLRPVVNMLERVITEEARILNASIKAEKFVSLSLVSDAFTAPSWEPGDKVDFQIDALSYRSYTPVRMDVQKGQMDLLIYLHGDSPATRCVSRLKRGEMVRIYGPRRSTRLGALPSCLSIFGDETSLALMAARKAQNLDFCGAECLVETDDVPSSTQMLDMLGLKDAKLFQRSKDSEHLKEMALQAHRWLSEKTERQILLTGRAHSIQFLRKALIASGIDKSRIESHAFWADGKTALG
ncbi:siderophore-interacting protein [Cohaesibacter gelatinilyticus]|uniref:Siderophore-interacting FAD-binding domain-containing protein n=1 Tax=Cohaesibacter gelatinilyticus TaxID=372072 RepID=A0A285PHQ0_9HYPH|nr:siderophore-interacting protein [Cohaesibacter gelatinilyticus]SNZ21262.1 Siderophore-interacting FAD-binding domain-containing protein [Cohaesibacter gelatinilyticus]